MLYPPLVGGQPFPDTLTPATTIVAKFGEPITGALAADVDGDGLTDLILSSPTARNGDGVVYIFYAPKIPGGAVFDLNTSLNYAQAARIVGQVQEGLGTTLAAVPPAVGSATSANLLAVGAPRFDRVYVFAPPASGEVSTSTSSTARATLLGGNTVGGALAGGVLGESMLVVGAPIQNSVYLIPATSLNGGRGIDLTRAMQISGSGRFGAALAIMTGLGTLLAVGAPDADTVALFNPGSGPQWTTGPGISFSGTPGSGFGSAVALGPPGVHFWLAVGAPQASPFGRLGGGEVVLFSVAGVPAPSTQQLVDVGEARLLIWPEADGEGLGAQLGFGNWDTSSTIQQLFVAKSTAPGAVYGIQSLPLP
jgi:hypothetical protein